MSSKKSKKLELYYVEKYEGQLGHFEIKGGKSIHTFLNTSFKNYMDGSNNITVSQLLVYCLPVELKSKYSELYDIFYNTPNECEDSQYSEFISAIVYKGVYDAKNFKAEGTIIREMRNYHDNMDGISPPDIYMSNIQKNPTLISVTRFNSQKNHRVRAENLLKTKIVKGLSSIYATNPLYKTDRCIIQVFCKSERNANILKDAWEKIVHIPSNIYLHIVLCKHEEIYYCNNFH